MLRAVKTGWVINMQDTICTVLSNDKIADEIYELILELPKDFTCTCHPGQFAEIKLPYHNEHILRRPISINSVSPQTATITFVYQVVGQGTQKLARISAGTPIQVLLPLGNGFAYQEDKNILMIGAGIGAAPLRYYAELNRNNRITAVLGFRNVGKMYQINEFNNICSKVYACTDDGSNGLKSYAAALAEQIVSKEHFDHIIACGPNVVLKKISEFANGMNIPCELSLEARMGCGIGACMGCNVTVKDVDGNHIYKRCCCDGPVFDAKEVIW